MAPFASTMEWNIRPPHGAFEQVLLRSPSGDGQKTGGLKQQAPNQANAEGFKLLVYLGLVWWVCTSRFGAWQLFDTQKKKWQLFDTHKKKTARTACGHQKQFGIRPLVDMHLLGTSPCTALPVTTPKNTSSGTQPMTRPM